MGIELNKILTKEMREWGFSLSEDDHDVYLYLGKTTVAVFTQPMAEDIHAEVLHLMGAIVAFETTFKFIEDASEYCRDVGFKDPE